MDAFLFWGAMLFAVFALGITHFGNANRSTPWLPFFMLFAALTYVVLETAERLNLAIDAMRAAGLFAR